MPDSSTSTLDDVASIPPPTGSGESIIKNLQGSFKKLNGKNYLFWKQSFMGFIGAYEKQSHLTDDPPATTSKTYAKWKAHDYAVKSWMTSTMEPDVARSFLMMATAKEIWDACKETYGNETNISRVYELHGQLHSLKLADKSYQDYYSQFRSIITELEIYQPVVPDINTIKQQCNDLYVCAFLDGLPPDVRKQLNGQVFNSATVPSLASVYGLLIRTPVVPTTTSLPPPPSDTSALASFRGRGASNSARGRGGHSGRGRGRPTCQY